MIDKPTTLEEARAAKAEALAVFSELADVVGVGITSRGEEYCLKVNLRVSPDSAVKLPTHVAGVPVTIDVVGRITKGSANDFQ